MKGLYQNNVGEVARYSTKLEPAEEQKLEGCWVCATEESLLCLIWVWTRLHAENNDRFYCLILCSW